MKQLRGGVSDTHDLFCSQNREAMVDGHLDSNVQYWLMELQQTQPLINSYSMEVRACSVNVLKQSHGVLTAE
jgi:hypothetical protein